MSDAPPPLLVIPDALVKDALQEVRKHPAFARQLVGVIPIVVRSGRALCYWHENGCLAWFRPDSSEMPMVYTTAGGILRRLAAMREDDETPEASEVTAAIWVHPDAQVEPIEKYVRMTGKQFHGCPRS